MISTATWQRPGTAARYLVALAAWGLALGLTMALAPHLGRTIFLFFWAATIFAAWFGGLGPALLVSVASVVAADYYLVPPYRGFVPTDPGDLVPLALFVLLAAVVSRLTSDLRRAEERSARAARELEERARLLEEQAVELEQQREEAQVLAEELEQTNEELHAATREAERERDRTRGVLTGISDSYLFLDREWRVVEVNPAAERQLGRSAAQLVGRTHWEEWPASVGSEVERRYRQAVEEQVAVHFTHHCHDAAYDAHLEIDAYPSAEGLAVFFRDITERRRAEAERQQLLARADAARRDAERAQREAEEASQAKSQFLATMSHEIRTPINAVMGYADLMQAGVAGPLTERQEEYLQRVKASSRHLLGLVDDVLDLSKVEAGRLEVASEHGDVAGVIAAATSLVQPQADTRGIGLENRCAQECEFPYLGDEDRVRQVLVNLLSNAVKFTEPGGRVVVTAELTTEPDAEAHLSGPGPWTCVRVADTGIGIAPEQIEAVFRAFVQAETGRTRTRGGTGLGLTISREFARLMGGDLTVRSTPGQGATFTLWLPTRAVETGGPVPARGAARAGEVIQTGLDSLVRAYATRLRADPTLPEADDVLRADLEDHTAAFLADIAQELVILEEAGGRAELLRDGSDLQRLISERHGAQRRRLGWTEEGLRREYRILAEEVEQVVRRTFAAGDPAADRAMELLAGLLAAAEDASLRGMRAGGDGPPGLLDWTRDTIEATRSTIHRVKRAVVGDGAGPPGAGGEVPGE